MPQPETEPLPPAVETWGLNRWTTMEVPVMNYFSIKKKKRKQPSLKKIPSKTLHLILWHVLGAQ